MRYLALAALAVPALFGLLVVFVVILKLTGKDRVHLTADQVADTIERFIEHRDGRWDWDDFISISIKDPELDAIRLRCCDLPEEFPANGTYCSSEGVAVMRELVTQLRGVSGDPAD